MFSFSLKSNYLIFTLQSKFSKFVQPISVTAPAGHQAKTKPITNERDEIVSQFMVVAKSQAIIPSDFIKVLSTEIDDGNDVIVKSRLRHALLVPSPMKPSIEGINRLIKPDVHECEEEIDLDHFLLLLSQEAALENRQHNAPKSAESCLGDRIAIAEKGVLVKTVPAVQVTKS